MMKSLVEWLGDALLESRIMEQAMTRKDFKMKFHHSIDRIIENWCMIRYAEVTGQEKYSRCINHWKQELRAAIDPLFRARLKSGDKKSITAEIKDAYFGQYDTDPWEAYEYVYRTLTDKLDIEGDNDIRYKDVTLVSNSFIKDIDNIFDMISSDNFSGMRKYIESL